jgi:hypothetical protein
MDRLVTDLSSSAKVRSIPADLQVLTNQFLPRNDRLAKLVVP